jgi:hypothetical protein
MTDAINERRSSPRFALTVAAVSEPFSSCEMIGRLADVSRTRCYADTVNPPTPGMHVKIRLRIEDEHFETLAKVIHVPLQRGMGLNWGTNPQAQNLEVLHIVKSIRREPLRNSRSAQAKQGTAVSTGPELSLHLFPRRN